MRPSHTVLDPSGRYDGEPGACAKSSWRIPFEAENGCRFRTPSMTGVGGSYIQLMPNGVVADRIAPMCR